MAVTGASGGGGFDGGAAESRAVRGCKVVASGDAAMPGGIGCRTPPASERAVTLVDTGCARSTPRAAPVIAARNSPIVA